MLGIFMAFLSVPNAPTYHFSMHFYPQKNPMRKFESFFSSEISPKETRFVIDGMNVCGEARKCPTVVEYNT